MQPPIICCVSGLEVAIFLPEKETLKSVQKKQKKEKEHELCVIFVTHGRGGKMEDTFPYCQSIISSSSSSSSSSLSNTFTFVAIAIEQRNHGKRLVDSKCNEGWRPFHEEGGEGEGEGEGYPHHPSDMYGTQLGTARDISSVLDLLPARLGLNPSKVGVTGVSLGGHASLLVLASDPRFHVCCSVIGCGDYLSLMRHRAQQNNVDPDSPLFSQHYFPQGLRTLVERQDPINNISSFLNKHVILLCGAKDTLVPSSCSSEFISKVQGLHASSSSSSSSSIEMKFFKGVGHQFPEQMRKDAAEWLVNKLTLPILSSSPSPPCSSTKSSL